MSAPTVRVPLLALLAIGAAGCFGSAKEERGAEYLDDAVITDRVEQALRREAGDTLAQVHVETAGGVVRLTGVVDSPARCTRAAAIAAQVPRVREVRNELRVRN